MIKSIQNSLLLVGPGKHFGKDIYVKTVVIDGVVRENGPLYPQDVANLFWNAHHNEKEDLFLLK